MLLIFEYFMAIRTSDISSRLEDYGNLVKNEFKYTNYETYRQRKQVVNKKTCTVIIEI